MTPSSRRSLTVTTALGLLYVAQGIPFGFASEYLPVVLRGEGYSLRSIGLLSLLQLPWQLKVFWARIADAPSARRRSGRILLALQACLAVTVAGFALASLHEAPIFWFVLTALAATFAATQDVFVDAFAVRVLRPEERGYGNTAQVAGYRAGMLIGGAGLLLFVGRWGERATILACAAILFATSLGARMARRMSVERAGDAHAVENADDAQPASIGVLARHVLRKETRDVLLLALTFKLGIHVASALLKPMLRDFHWSTERIGGAAVLVGAVTSLAGAAAGGWMHRRLGEKRALYTSAILHALACAPLVFVARLAAPYGLSTFAMAFEHFVSGAGTTVLFAALMSATRPADAGLHYTVLTSANALAIGAGAWAGGAFADAFGFETTFVLAALLGLAPMVLVRRWHAASAASAAITEA